MDPCKLQNYDCCCIARMLETRFGVILTFFIVADISELLKCHLQDAGNKMGSLMVTKVKLRFYTLAALRLFGQIEFHKERHPIRPIVSTINTPVSRILIEIFRR